MKKEIADLCKAFLLDDSEITEILSVFDEFVDEYNNEAIADVISKIMEEYGSAKDDAAKNKAVDKLLLNMVLVFNSNWIGESNKGEINEVYEALLKSMVLFDDNAKIVEAIGTNDTDVIIQAVLECYPDYIQSYKKSGADLEDSEFDTLFAALRNSAKTDKAKVELEQAKKDAINAVNQALPKNASNEAKAVAKKAAEDIQNAQSIEVVNEIKTEAIKQIQSLPTADVCIHCGKEHQSLFDDVWCFVVRYFKAVHEIHLTAYNAIRVFIYDIFHI